MPIETKINLTRAGIFPHITNADEAHNLCKTGHKSSTKSTADSSIVASGGGVTAFVARMNRNKQGSINDATSNSSWSSLVVPRAQERTTRFCGLNVNTPETGP